uniref:Uncharacterized protein n=1 Tax=Arundo donax TaxID=35708 RepID=A0A0A9BDN9_ARUDO
MLRLASSFSASSMQPRHATISFRLNWASLRLSSAFLSISIFYSCSH